MGGRDQDVCGASRMPLSNCPNCPASSLKPLAFLCPPPPKGVASGKVSKAGTERSPTFTELDPFTSHINANVPHRLASRFPRSEWKTPGALHEPRLSLDGDRLGFAGDVLHQAHELCVHSAAGSDDGSLRKLSIGAACSLAVCTACAPQATPIAHPARKLGKTGLRGAFCFPTHALTHVRGRRLRGRHI